MFNPDELLSDREEKNAFIKELAQNGDVVSVRANVVGADKNLPEANLVVSYFSKIIENYGCVLVNVNDGASGRVAVFKTENGKSVKDFAINLEETHPIGRLVDIDVTLKGETSSLSRGKMRKCFLCDNPAFVCGRLKTHTEKELNLWFCEKVREFFKSLLIDELVFSMTAELNLENKFGLVTPTSNGSHTDLNYALMLDAQKAVAPYIADCFIKGLTAKSTEGLLNELRPCGLDAEREMYISTHGANAYKGFIFAGGVLLASLGYKTGNAVKGKTVFDISAEICKGISNEVDEINETFGDTARKLYGFGGIKATAEQGFKPVEFAVKLIKNGETDLNKLLVKIVSVTDDSVLLKRAGSIDRYESFKREISSVDVGDKFALLCLNEKCLKNGISIGGSADILIASVLIDRLEKLFIY